MPKIFKDFMYYWIDDEGYVYESDQHPRSEEFIDHWYFAEDCIYFNDGDVLVTYFPDGKITTIDL